MMECMRLVPAFVREPEAQARARIALASRYTNKIRTAMPPEFEIWAPVVMIIVATAALIWYELRFLVQVAQPLPRVLKGKVTAAFLAEVAEVCREAGIRRGLLGGIRKGKRTVLVFSWHFPRGIRQRLRNLWAIHR